VLSLVVLGAHFMRYGYSIVVFGLLALIALLFVRRPWVARLTQIVLILGAAFAVTRAEADLPAEIEQARH
jgi:hypothetical protein